ncbi:MAG: FKBP-type peptidyl-prolyl cis-trans isomerase [Cytophagaceae bacterium]|nr:FKBP-type peptidyl-prolyl cis-trans isomerase [Cytophagaceae bacterium]
MFRTLTILTLAAVSLASCNQFRVSVTDSGLKYQFHEHDEKGRLAKVGDILTFHLVLKNNKDSVLRNTVKEMTPLKVMLQPPAFKGAFEEGLALLAKGDSATFFVSADSLFTKAMQPMPPAIAKGSDVSFTVKVLDVQNREEYEKNMELSRAKQKETDAKQIADYLSKNGLANPQRTTMGVTYVVRTPGSGMQPTQGDSVQVRYTGKLLNGKVFDSNTAEGIVFPVGVGMVIPGWDDGILRLKKGDKATLLVPSELAYGEQGVPGSIPPNSVLAFDVELLNVKKGIRR